MSYPGLDPPEPPKRSLVCPPRITPIACIATTPLSISVFDDQRIYFLPYGGAMRAPNRSKKVSILEVYILACGARDQPCLISMMLLRTGTCMNSNEADNFRESPKSVII